MQRKQKKNNGNTNGSKHKVDKSVCYRPWRAKRGQRKRKLEESTTTRRHRQQDKNIAKMKQRLPNYLGYRLKFMKEKWAALRVWNSGRNLPITEDICIVLRRIYHVLDKDYDKWETPIAHVIKCKEFLQGFGEASHLAIGVAIPSRKI